MNGTGFDSPTSKGDKLLSRKLIMVRTLILIRQGKDAETAPRLTFMRAYLCSEKTFKYL